MDIDQRVEHLGDIVRKDQTYKAQHVRRYVPEITDGYMKTPSGIGWGTNLNEDALKEHLWDK